MRKGRFVRRILLVIGVCSLLGIEAQAASSKAYLNANDNFVTTGTVQTVGDSGADRYVTYYGQVYGTSKNPASFGVYFLVNGEWKIGRDGLKENQQPGSSFLSTSAWGKGNFAYLKIAAGRDMFAYLNKNAIAEGTINGQ